VEPVRIKLYGLFPHTRQRYVVQLVIAFALMTILLVGWWLLRPSFHEHTQGHSYPGIERLKAFFNAIPWIVLVIAGLQSLEAFIVLRLFRRMEAEQQVPAPPAG
jgi:cyanate permease